MRETRSSGSVEGVMSNRDPYSDKFGLSWAWHSDRNAAPTTRHVH
jgi:hypothetical protein